MDADGLPIVGPGIDFAKVGAIHQKRTVAFLNHFITHTARFLNRFSCVCEERLEKLSVRIQTLETTMNILEAKLSSIPGLENVTVPQSSSVNETASSSTPSQPSSSLPQQETSNTAQETVASSAVEAPPAEPEKTKMTVAQDPRYAKYFKWVKVGISVENVKMKMKMEGLDPDLIDTPDAPAPGGSLQKDADTDDDFDDEQQESDSDSEASFSD